MVRATVKPWLESRSTHTTHPQDLAPGLAPLLGAFALGPTVGAMAQSIGAYRVSLAMIVAHRQHLARAHHY